MGDRSDEKTSEGVLEEYRECIKDYIESNTELLNWILDKVDGRQIGEPRTMAQEKRVAWIAVIMREMGAKLFVRLNKKYRVEKKEEASDGATAKESDGPEMESFLNFVSDSALC